MNIFVLDLDPEVAARQQCDRHVVKMVLESAQLMATALISHGHEAPYKATHVNHPCAVWARASRINYAWLLAHHTAMLDEYTKRFRRVHNTQQHLLHWQQGLAAIPLTPMTPFAQAMPVELKVPNDPVRAYRGFYLRDKISFARWTLTPAPDWWQP